MIYTHKCVMIYKAFALVICNFYEIDDIHTHKCVILVEISISYRGLRC